MTAQAVPIWIEDEDGAIVRGTTESVSAGGARVLLMSAPRFAEGAGVALRIRFDPERPSVAATARVSWIRSDDSPAECELEWTQLEAALEQWLSGVGTLGA